MNGAHHRLKSVANKKTVRLKPAWNTPVVLWIRTQGVHDILRGFYWEPRCVGLFPTLSFEKGWGTHAIVRRVGVIEAARAKARGSSMLQNRAR